MLMVGKVAVVIALVAGPGPDDPAPVRPQPSDENCASPGVCQKDVEKWIVEVDGRLGNSQYDPHVSAIAKRVIAECKRIGCPPNEAPNGVIERTIREIANEQNPDRGLQKMKNHSTNPAQSAEDPYELEPLFVWGVLGLGVVLGITIVRNSRKKDD